MRLVVQRVSSASVVVEGKVTGAIDRGLLVLVGIHVADTEDDVAWLAAKISALRIFEDEAGRMNRSIVEVAADLVPDRPTVLVVSQFTLISSTRKGTRPSFNDAAKPDVAVPLYESFVAAIGRDVARPVATGVFGAMMSVHLVNDGPVTLVIDSRLRE
jgi:D-tyrosyl-tRNA(Tyr) deacylase